ANVTGLRGRGLAGSASAASRARRSAPSVAIAILLREVFDVCLRRTPEIKHAAPQEGDQVARTPGALHLFAEALVGVAGYERLRLADRGLHHVCIKLGRDCNGAPVRRQL